MMVIRITLTNRTTTPDLFELMKVMGEKGVLYRMQTFWVIPFN
ncbi:hypothetical protein ACFSO7_06605 [Bacillus sp. CGMCC 1.16607]